MGRLSNSTPGRTVVRGRARLVGDAVRTQLWPWPAASIVLAVALGAGLPALDRRVDGRLPEWLRSSLFGGDADAARTVLDAVASSLITVTSLTFSLTVVTLQLASSQFSPRLLRTFTRDLFVQATLAIFVGTFTYALTVLRAVRATTDIAGGVPAVAVTAAVVLAVASVFVLVLFLAHLARELRVETMLRNVRADASRSADRLFGDQDATGDGPGPPEEMAGGTDVIHLVARNSGFLLQVDERALLAVAVDTGTYIVVEERPGAFVIEGVPFGCVWALPGGSAEEGAPGDLGRRIWNAIATGTERTAVQDVGFGLRQLTDVVVKALSPGINDPTTAVHALDQSTALLCDLARHPLGDRVLRDRTGVPRVVLRRPTLGELLDEAVTQPRRYGSQDPAVLAALFRMLRALRWSVTRPADTAAVDSQLTILERAVDNEDFDPAHRASLRALARSVELAGPGQRPHADESKG
jgi:uncharacterized membrane protein